MPGSNLNILSVLEELDNELASMRGKIYLAKDVRKTPEIFKKIYNNYEKWRSIKKKIDPDNFISQICLKD